MPNLTRLHMAADALERFHKNTTGVRGFINRILKGANYVNFDIRYWRQPTPERAKNHGHSCGTAACALGYLAIHPAFNSLGLRLSNFMDGCKDYGNYPVYEGYEGYEAGSMFFDITYSQSKDLFRPTAYGKPEEEVTALDVATRIRTMFPAAPKNSLDV